jgi:D-beta-D-heptose 7-phosphate kinase/D-beta-D-heptose 1-phosphate adenosyltransferase
MDVMGELVKSLFLENKIPFDPKLESATADTITKSRVVVREQQLCRIDRENKKSHYAITDGSLVDQICEKIQPVDALILSDYAKGTISNGNVSKFIDAANAENTFIAMDPSLLMDRPFLVSRLSPQTRKNLSSSQGSK